MPERVTPGEIVTTEEALELFAVPDTVAVRLDVTALAVAMKLTRLYPAGIVTDAGTFKALFEEARLTTVAPMPSLDNLTMQLAGALDVSTIGVHVRVETIGSADDGATETVATLLTPLHVPDTFTTETTETTPTVELKLAEVAPAAMIRLEGTGSSCEEDVILTATFD